MLLFSNFKVDENFCSIKFENNNLTVLILEFFGIPYFETTKLLLSNLKVNEPIFLLSQ